MVKYNRFMGEYDENTLYEAGDVVAFGEAAYYRKVPGRGISPIAQKKPYAVWSMLSEDLSTVFALLGLGQTAGHGAQSLMIERIGDEFEIKHTLEETMAIIESGAVPVLLHRDTASAQWGTYYCSNVILHDGILDLYFYSELDGWTVMRYDENGLYLRLPE